MNRPGFEGAAGALEAVTQFAPVSITSLIAVGT